MKASVITLGCKVNEYESQSILNQLKQVGYEISEGLVFADVYIVNTCAVTNTAEKKSRQVIGKLIKINPDAKKIFMNVYNPYREFLTAKNAPIPVPTSPANPVISVIIPFAVVIHSVKNSILSLLYLILRLS